MNGPRCSVTSVARGSLREIGGYVFGSPGWRPDGTGPTAANVRAAWVSDVE